MKTDAYLSLCLEQAAKSSLHYKHGCIIVNGGKVIGHGYNDYKPGFNGGALKIGRIAKGAFDGPAIASLKSKLKKQKDKPQQQTTFTPFEATSGGEHNANVPLSIHSEMMAVHSALAASSTLSSTAFAREKSCFKLPRSDKRKARLRREVLASYVKAVCEVTQGSAGSAGSGQVQVQECGFETSAYQPSTPPPRLQQQGGAGVGGCGGGRVETGGKGVSGGLEWRETSSEEEWEEERGVLLSVSVPGSVRPVWRTDTPTTVICV